MAHLQRPAPDVEKTWQYALAIEKQLTVAVKATSPAPTFDEIEGMIQEMRKALENIVTFDLAFAVKNHCENHLWTCHSDINKRYRKLVEAYKKGGDQKKHVERRKVEKRYVDFLKTSQFFYKSLIQRLASLYPGNFGLRRIAECLDLQILSANEAMSLDAVMALKLEQSCYHTLLHLGDLSRYRNQLRTKDRSWDIALGYYQLAQHLLPEIGVAHNQLAVIAISEGDHLTAVYHIYRAFTAVDPVRDSVKNLEIEFSSIISEKDKQGSQAKPDSLGLLTKWFTLLHAKYFHGSSFATQIELENEVLTRISSIIKTSKYTIDEALLKIVMINIAAEFFAAKKAFGINASEKALRTYVYCLNFNIRFFNTICKIVAPELESPSPGEDLPSGGSEKISDKITATCRQVLPTLRLYSVWLSANPKVITNYFLQGQNSAVSLDQMQVLEMWKSHGLVLSKLLGHFNGCDVRISPYMLEEDENTVGFAPFRCSGIPAELRMHFLDSGNPKPRITDRGVKRNQPDQEMYARVHDIIVIGYKLQESGAYPVIFKSDSGNFVFDEIALKNIASASTTFPESSAPEAQSTPAMSEQSAQSSRSRPLSSDQLGKPNVSRSFPPQNMEDQLNAMVLSLVDAKYGREQQSQHSRKPSSGTDTSYGMDSKMAQDVFGLGTTPSHQYTPKHLPRIPGIDGTFAPLPNELSPSNPGRRVTPTYSQYSTPEGRTAAANELERMTGYAQNSTWNTDQPLRNSNLAQASHLHAKYGTNNITNTHPKGFNFSTPLISNAHPLSSPSTPLRNESTIYPGGTDFETETMLRSSPWANGRPGFGTPYVQTPPAGQGQNNR